MRSRRRKGFSLLEVLLATGILVGCLAVLSELAAIGRRHVEDAERLTAAQTLCQAEINQILAGLEPAEAADEEELEDAPGWLSTVETSTLAQPGLLELRVTVREDVEERAPRQFTLVRWMPDPDYRRGEDRVGSRMPLPPGFRGGRGR